ncbi:adenylate cyclase [Chthoniobacter flavus]|uniref:adenylate/guanylate cyclase domain-containing protein n=1 Tax=Chthoniobacter flavus TaxID=191863 RepID=UPI0010F0A582|nr:adenylate/guanylate cyclase domain-containing protein [Chthoniobacter flavus]TCO89697.1 adenylate cyclase [Chthoniobacter flavus]
MICLLCTAAVAVLYVQGWFYGDAERTSRDWLLTNTAARRLPADPRIVLLGIDEATRSLDAVFSDDLEKSPTLRLMKEGFPWKREVYAAIVDRLADAGASAIIFDIVFPAEKPGDDVFRAALLRHRDKVVIGSNLIDKRYILPAETLQPPPDGPSWIGFVNIRADADGLVRHIYYRTSVEEYFGIPASDHTREIFSLAARGLEKAGLVDRLPPGHRPVIFRYSEDVVPHSLHEIFVDAQWNAPPYNHGELFRDKIVVIGNTEQASEDRVQTPYGITSGVNIHLNALNSALKGDFLTDLSTQANLALVVLGGIMAWLLGAWVRRPLLRLFVLALAILAYYEIAQNLANNYNLIPSLLSPLITLIASGIVWAAWEQVLDRIEKQRTRKALDRYVGKDVAREVLDNPASFLNTLHGERKQITIIFSDIRGFTTRTETADPQALVSQLNEYFEAMVAIVYAHRGTLDKFIGDCVMAHWGSIISNGPVTDTESAVSAMLDMRARTAKLNAEWVKRGIGAIQVGFGVNQGEAIVGNLGCEAKMEVSTIGDAVNLGSRLEGATKQYHIDSCVGENVAGLVRDKFVLRSVDLIIVKGKTQPVEIFTVLSRRGAPEPAWLPRHEEAVRLYRAGEFTAAEKIWREVLAQAPGDGLAETFIARCVELQAHPPTGPWDGVYEMKSK